MRAQNAGGVKGNRDRAVTPSTRRRGVADDVGVPAHEEERHGTHTEQPSHPERVVTETGHAERTGHPQEGEEAEEKRTATKTRYHSRGWSSVHTASPARTKPAARHESAIRARYVAERVRRRAMPVPEQRAHMDPYRDPLHAWICAPLVPFRTTPVREAQQDRPRP